MDAFLKHTSQETVATTSPQKMRLVRYLASEELTLSQYITPNTIISRSDTAKTEYVLAGTFLSFGIAILFGLMAGI